MTETAEKAGEAIQDLAHAVAENAEPAVTHATFVVEKKVWQLGACCERLRIYL